MDGGNGSAVGGLAIGGGVFAVSAFAPRALPKSERKPQRDFEAILVLLASESVDASCAPAWHNARAAFMNGRFAAALSHVDAYLAAVTSAAGAEHVAFASAWRGMLLRVNGRPRDGLTSIAPNDVAAAARSWAWLERGRCHDMLGDVDAAMLCYERAGASA